MDYLVRLASPHRPSSVPLTCGIRSRLQEKGVMDAIEKKVRSARIHPARSDPG
jgi:hypothetical protein